MIRNTISIAETVEYLNSLLAADPLAMRAMLRTLTICNNTLAEHPSAQVWDCGDTAAIGLMGVINGLFGIDDNGWGAIAYCIDDESQVTAFVRRVSGDKDKEDVNV